MVFIKNPREYSSHFFDAGSGADPIEEICALVAAIKVGIDEELIREIHHDVVNIFIGKSPQFKRNVMYYHTLRHTMMVTLAAVRLLHGLSCEGRPLNKKIVLQGILCAYFHDIGLLVKRGDPTEAFSYIPVHEKRSALFLREYIAAKGWPAELGNGVDTIIAYTWLQFDPACHPDQSAEEQMLGKVVGIADLIAQMGDWYYAESLPLLLKEMERGGLKIYKDLQDILVRTTDFYRNIVEVRFFSTFADVFGAMKTHFRVWNGLERNLYMDAVEKNLRYIDLVLEECEDSECLAARLRRTAPVLEEKFPLG